MSTATIQPTDTAYRQLIARAVRIANAADVMDFNGHVSLRDAADHNVMWINNRHASRSTLTADDIVPYDIRAGRRIGEGIEPPSEHYIHREIYLRRPDVMGIQHSHPKAILTLSAAGQPLRAITSNAGFIPRDGAPVYREPFLVNTEARGVAMAEALGDAAIVVLRHHGTVTVGDCTEQAVVRMICAEENAKVLLQALAVGTPDFFSPDELAQLSREQGGKHSTRKFWHYHEETARRQGAFAGLE